MPDQIVDPVMAGAIQANVARVHSLLGWVIVQYPPQHPAAAFAARLVTAGPTDYVLLVPTSLESESRPNGLKGRRSARK
jgi:hypothetical protein